MSPEFFDHTPKIFEISSYENLYLVRRDGHLYRKDYYEFSLETQPSPGALISDLMIFNRRLIMEKQSSIEGGKSGYCKRLEIFRSLGFSDLKELEIYPGKKKDGASGNYPDVVAKTLAHGHCNVHVKWSTEYHSPITFIRESSARGWQYSSSEEQEALLAEILEGKPHEE